MQSSSISIPQVTAESPQDEHYWLALNRMKGVGPRVAARLLSVFASPTHLFNATFDELKAAGVADRQAEIAAQRQSGLPGGSSSDPRGVLHRGAVPRRSSQPRLHRQVGAAAALARAELRSP